MTMLMGTSSHCHPRIASPRHPRIALPRHPQMFWSGIQQHALSNSPLREMNPMDSRQKHAGMTTTALLVKFAALPFIR